MESIFAFRSDHFANPSNYDFTSSHVRWSHDLMRVLLCSLLCAAVHHLTCTRILKPMADRLVIADQRMAKATGKELKQHLQFKRAKFVSSGWKLLSYGKSFP